VFLFSGIVSIASMIAGLSFPVFLFTIFNAPSEFFKIFSVILAVAIIFTHRKNIKRLLRGEESRLIHLKKRHEA
jgi:glycerol-3-phosphate acyltransferase PlsY